MRLLECLKNVYIKMDVNLMMYSVRAHLQGEYEDMKDCYKTLLTYIKVCIVSFFLPSSPPSCKGHSMSNQHKKYLTLTDLDETWFLHSVC